MATYVLELPYLAKLDWISRHEQFNKLPRRTANAVALRMSPDLLLKGQSTGVKVRKDEVIKLKDKPKPKQVRICKLFGGCCNHHK